MGLPFGGVPPVAVATLLWEAAVTLCMMVGVLLLAAGALMAATAAEVLLVS